MAGTPTAQALVIVDVQSGWLTGPHAVDGAEGLLARLEDGLSAARAGGALVVHVQDVGEADSSVPPGSAGRELALPVLPGDVVLPKAVDDAFVGTGLERLLRERGARTIVVGGLQSEMCVAATARGALAGGFSVALPRDLHATREIPADDDHPVVPAEQVRRVAEWSLGNAGGRQQRRRRGLRVARRVSVPGHAGGPAGGGCGAGSDSAAGSLVE